MHLSNGMIAVVFALVYCSCRTLGLTRWVRLHVSFQVWTLYNHRGLSCCHF